MVSTARDDGSLWYCVVAMILSSYENDADKNAENCVERRTVNRRGSREMDITEKTCTKNGRLRKCRAKSFKKIVRLELVSIEIEE